MEKPKIAQKPNMRVVVDTREQKPYRFERYPGIAVECGTLAIGDYSLTGLTDKVAVERKELADLITCLGRERERFERELAKAAAMEAFAVVIEADWKDLASGNYKSQLKPHAACQSVMAFVGRYRIPFLFSGTRLAAEYMTHGFLLQYLQGARKRLKAILMAHGDAA